MASLKRDCQGEMKSGNTSNNTVRDFHSAEPSSADFLNETYCTRGMSNGKEFRMTTSNKGKQSLVREGYMYRLDHSGKDKLSWRCSTRGCPAHLKTDHSKETIVQDNQKAHTHAADADKFERQLLRIACKRKAVEDCSTKAQDIITNEMTKINGLNLPSKSTKFLQLAMYRERKKVFPKLPQQAKSTKKSPKRQEKYGEPSQKYSEPNQKYNDPNQKYSDPNQKYNEPNQKFNSHSDGVTSIPQPHIPNPAANFYPHPGPTSYEPHFDMLTDDDGTDFHPQPPHPHNPHMDHPLPNNSIGLHPLPQHLHQQQLPPPPQQQTQLQQHDLLQPHQLDSVLPQILFCNSNNHFPGPMIVASTTSNSTNNIQHFSSCALQKKICYADVRIHEEMLNDKVRTLAYRRALQENRNRLKGAAVLDVGAGTGILSHFAMQAGAARVFAVEASSIATYAEKIVRENDAESVITVVQSKVENADIPVKVDAIVSEWMGYNLFYESMLPSVLVARDRFLKPGGEMYPCSASLYLAPITDEDLQERLKNWKQVKSLYGVSMESLVSLTREALAVRADSRHLEVEAVLANASQLCQFDLKTMTQQDAQQVKADFCFKCYGHNTMHGFATWFTVAFPGSVSIDTSPYALKTHWGQTVMYLKSPLNVKQDSEIKGTFSMLPSSVNHRFWDIEIEYQLNRGRKYTQQWQCAE